ncbi:hypothetical protein HF086_000004 [Spodoptera exigua]|uniref:Uncharacterized protein n=1 Tax=Spodoptera exigua TaxID=7107 RepID=A0A922SJ40_SPOEX|nr:hypothetical protein HF086_000004 [Spodoptera exigua]
MTDIDVVWVGPHLASRNRICSACATTCCSMLSHANARYRIPQIKKAIAQKALYHVCANSDECNDGLICGTPNVTGTTPLHLRVHPPSEKICLCDVDSGFTEKEHACNDAEILKTSLLAIFVVSCIRKILAN